MKLLKLNTITAFLAALILFSGCEGFLDVNEDPNSPTQAPEDLQLSAIQGVFSYEILAGRGPRATSQWIQQTAWNGVQPSFDTYEVLPVDANPVWTNSYTEVMNNAWEMIELAEQNGNYDYAGIGRIIIAWNLGIVTDTFGDVPYTQAWNVVEYPAPAFDSQEEVYGAIFSLLRQGISNIEQGGPVSPGSDDLLYGGDMEKWTRLAYSLKARYHMHLTAAPGYSAEAMSDSALAALQNGLQSNADNANFQYYESDGSENPWFQFAIKNSWDTRNQMSQQYIQLLKDLNDPRLPVQARPVGEVDGQRDPVVDPVGLDTAEYAGAPNGEDDDIGDQDVSSIGSFYSAADAPLNWFNYAEAKFIEAEATFRSQGAGAAQSIYEDAIRASLEHLGVADTSITSYMNSAAVATLTSSNALEQIITHKYIANFLHYEPYNDWRRTGYPTLTPISNTDPIPDQLSGDIPVRFPWPEYEVSNNRAKVEETGIPLGIQGMDTNVWWDAN